MKNIASLIISMCLLLLSGAAMSLSALEESNKENVLAFYQLALNDKNFNAARPYLGEYYIQHNPLAQDGVEGFKKFIEYLAKTYPYSHSEIKRVFNEGDFVILHVHSIKEPGTRGEAIIDIFRLENNKIVEHWDVHQSIPETAANDNGML